jgi:hypothetical protein
MGAPGPIPVLRRCDAEAERSAGIEASDGSELLRVRFRPRAEEDLVGEEHAFERDPRLVVLEADPAVEGPGIAPGDEAEDGRGVRGGFGGVPARAGAQNLDGRAEGRGGEEADRGGGKAGGDGGGLHGIPLPWGV